MSRQAGSIVRGISKPRRISVKAGRQQVARMYCGYGQRSRWRELPPRLRSGPGAGALRPPTCVSDGLGHRLGARHLDGLRDVLPQVFPTRSSATRSSTTGSAGPGTADPGTSTRTPADPLPGRAHRAANHAIQRHHPSPNHDGMRIRANRSQDHASHRRTSSNFVRRRRNFVRRRRFAPVPDHWGWPSP